MVFIAQNNNHLLLFFYVLFDIIPLYWRLGGCDDAKAVPAIMEALFFPLFQTIIFDFSKYQSLN